MFEEIIYVDAEDASIFDVFFLKLLILSFLSVSYILRSQDHTAREDRDISSTLRTLLVD